MIGAQLRTAAEAVHHAVYVRLARAGHDELRPAHFALLQFPGPHGTRPTDLAARVGLSKQALNPLLNDLEQWGYLRRTSDNEDRRNRVVTLTPRGMALVEVMRETLEEIEERLTDRLGTTGFDAFQHALNQTGAAAREASTSPAARTSPDR
jgi:DNA-binding MarR family transcriptional regulator